MENRFHTIADVHRYLEGIPQFSRSGLKAADFNLDRMITICSEIGDPQKNLNAVHVAGTNGKGTTCQMLESVYHMAGYKTGIYLSPHFITFNERIRSNGRQIRDEELLDFFRRFGRLIRQYRPTYFEISTILAFWYLDRESCDIVFIETGLGGRLDATNVLDPLVSVITSISYDHTDILGEKLEEIAREKGGIIKPGKPVVAGSLLDETVEVLREIAENRQSEIHLSSRYEPQWRGQTILLQNPDTGRKIEIDGGGRKTVDCFNAALTLTVTEVLREHFPVNTIDFITGIQETDKRFPEHGHFQKLDAERDWFFDGAHNMEAVKSVIEQTNQLRDGREPFFILSMMTDKAKKEVLENFQPFNNVYYIEEGSERCASCEQVLPILPQAVCIRGVHAEMKRILSSLKTELVIFTGSFYFYQQVKRWMASQPPSDHETETVLHP